MLRVGRFETLHRGWRMRVCIMILMSGLKRKEKVRVFMGSD
jgi:hypothetical protein